MKNEANMVKIKGDLDLKMTKLTGDIEANKKRMESDAARQEQEHLREMDKTGKSHELETLKIQKESENISQLRNLNYI